MKKLITTLLWFLLLTVLAFFLLIVVGCSTTKVMKETIIEKRIDTIYVELPERIDTVYKENVSITTGEIGEIFSAGIVDGNDTVVVVQFVAGDTTFIVEVYPDTFIVEKVRLDTVQVITNIEEPTILEQWWWLFLLAIIGTIIIIVLIRR